MASPVPDTLKDGRTRLWFASLALLAKAEQVFFSNWSEAARTLDEESIHDLRVASRRLREALTLFSPALPRARCAKALKQTKRVTRMLGELRNADEGFLFFSSLGADERSRCQWEVDQLLQELGREREQAREGLSRRFKELGQQPLRNRLRALRDRPNLFRSREADPFQEFSLFAGKALMERADAVDSLLPGALDEADSAAQHALRIAVKMMRYRLEAVEPLMAEGCPGLRDALKSYQEVLGKLHDLDVFGEMVRERVREGPGREKLLRVIAGRRGGVFAAFLELVHRLLLATAAKEAVAKISAQEGRPDRPSSLRSPCKPQRQKRGSTSPGCRSADDSGGS